MKYYLVSEEQLVGLRHAAQDFESGDFDFEDMRDADSDCRKIEVPSSVAKRLLSTLGDLKGTVGITEEET